MKTILVTGLDGFIGANFVEYFICQHSDVTVLNLVEITYAADLCNLQFVATNPRYEFVKGDICNSELIEYLYVKYDISGVVYFAAESHVDNLISCTELFVKTNVNSTFTLLDVAREHWMEVPFEFKGGYEGSRFHHISTDEVCDTLGMTGLFVEQSPYAPNNPNSSSKAGSDLLERAYFHTYGMEVITRNCSNNYGPYKHDETLIPIIIRNTLNGDNIPNLREWKEY